MSVHPRRFNFILPDTYKEAVLRADRHISLQKRPVVNQKSVFCLCVFSSFLVLRKMHVVGIEENNIVNIY